MPSPRAVLIDIHELNLDPKSAHKRVSTKGTLRPNVPLNVESNKINDTEVVVEKHKPKKKNKAKTEE